MNSEALASAYKYKLSPARYELIELPIRYGDALVRIAMPTPKQQSTRFFSLEVSASDTNGLYF